MKLKSSILIYDNAKREIHCRYILKSDNKVSFQIETYDLSKLLVIDTVLAYATYIGGSDADMGLGIAAESSGNTYVTGGTF